MNARAAYSLIGLTFILLIGGAWYYSSHESETAAPLSSPQKNAMKLISPAFQANASIPAKYTCDESQISPPITIADAPVGAKSFALIMEDPDVPKALKPDGIFLHWMLYNIPAGTSELFEGKPVGVLGNNGAGKPGYAGPCPPPQYEPSEHRYFFYLYALDTELRLKEGASKDEVLEAMQGHILAEAVLVGKYKRK